LIPTLHRRVPRARISLAVPLAVAGVLAALPLAAQPGQGPVPVGVTAARSHEMQRSVRLSGNVEARRSSVVASEVEGLVVTLAAREGDFVRRGQTLVELRRRPQELRLEARQAALAEAEARLQLARHTLERSKELFTSEVISRQTLDDAVSELAAWQGRVESLKAEIAQVEDDLERSAVRAPFSGVVVEEHTQVGEWIATGGPVVEMLDVEELEVVLEVPERYFADLRPGTSGRVSFEALPGLVLTGEIGAVIPRADRQARTFPVKVRFPNREHRVAVGMLAQVELPVGEVSPATVVPKDAVVRRGPQELVYRVTGGGTVETVEVRTGSGDGAWIAVEGPVEPGDRVVTRGNERLRPGQTVEATPVEYPVD
jgi:RND family efflux transporter MFP subunit